ncbi:MAG TPA: hypothetical protein VF393_01370 [archaeon]
MAIFGSLLSSATGRRGNLEKRPAAVIEEVKNEKKYAEGGP